VSKFVKRAKTTPITGFASPQTAAAVIAKRISILGLFNAMILPKADFFYNNLSYA